MKGATAGRTGERHHYRLVKIQRLTAGADELARQPSPQAARTTCHPIPLAPPPWLTTWRRGDDHLPRWVWQRRPNAVG